MSPLSPLARRVLQAVLPVCERYGLVLAGEAALRAHGMGEGAAEEVELVTRAPLDGAGERIALALWEAGLEVAVEGGRLVAVEQGTGRRCPVDVGSEALGRAPAVRGGLPVAALDDVVGLRVRDLHERGLPGDAAGLAAVAHLYSFRELERLGRRHTPGFSLAELRMRLGFVAGEGGEDRRVRAFAAAWLEDLALRRAEDGDAEYDHPDLPAVD